MFQNNLIHIIPSNLSLLQAPPLPDFNPYYLSLGLCSQPSFLPPPLEMRASDLLKSSSDHVTLWPNSFDAFDYLQKKSANSSMPSKGSPYLPASTSAHSRQALGFIPMLLSYWPFSIILRTQALLSSCCFLCPHSFSFSFIHKIPLFFQRAALLSTGKVLSFRISLCPLCFHCTLLTVLGILTCSTAGLVYKDQA